MSEMIKCEDGGKLLLRLTVGVLMLFHGVAKILHTGSLDFIRMGLSGYGLPEFIAYGVYVGEVVAPLLLIVGVLARWGGLVIVVNMLFAIALAHSGDLFALTEHGGYRLELQMFYLLGGAVIFMIGSGKFALKPD